MEILIFIYIYVGLIILHEMTHFITAYFQKIPVISINILCVKFSKKGISLSFDSLLSGYIILDLHQVDSEKAFLKMIKKIKINLWMPACLHVILGLLAIVYLLYHLENTTIVLISSALIFWNFWFLLSVFSNKKGDIYVYKYYQNLDYLTFLVTSDIVYECKNDYIYQEVVSAIKKEHIIENTRKIFLNYMIEYALSNQIKTDIVLIENQIVSIEQSLFKDFLRFKLEVLCYILNVSYQDEISIVYEHAYVAHKRQRFFKKIEGHEKIEEKDFKISHKMMFESISSIKLKKMIDIINQKHEVIS